MPDEQAPSASWLDNLLTSLHCEDRGELAWFAGRTPRIDCYVEQPLMQIEQQLADKQCLFCLGLRTDERQPPICASCESNGVSSDDDGVPTQGICSICGAENYRIMLDDYDPVDAPGLACPICFRLSCLWPVSSTKVRDDSPPA